MATHRFGAAEYAGDRLSSGVGSLLLLSFFFLFFFFSLAWCAALPACLPALSPSHCHYRRIKSLVPLPGCRSVRWRLQAAFLAIAAQLPRLLCLGTARRSRL